MYYLGFLKKNMKDVVIFKSIVKPKKGDYRYFTGVMGPYGSEVEARKSLSAMRGQGYRENPATSERQRRFMCAELGRLRSGKKTQTGMSDKQLGDFCRKSNPFIAESQIRIGTRHELEHTTDRVIARKIACDHLKEDPKYYTHLAAMEKTYKRNPSKKYMSDRRALALTKKIIAYGKRLFKHEQSEIRKGNPASDHMSKFIRGMKTLERYAVGSKPYIEALAKTYADLQAAKKVMGK
jgi:hypothetical protein